MLIGIMQPYFLPYIGYFQLIHSVDKFVIYDNIKYTKSGWINRNRILCNGESYLFTIPLQKTSDAAFIDDRQISESFNKRKLLKQIHFTYKNAPYFEEVYPLIRNIVEFDNINLFQYIYNSISEICNYIDIKTSIILSSSLKIDHGLKGVDRVISIVQELQGTTYINSIGGVELYDRVIFRDSGIDLYFLIPEIKNYKQFSNDFVADLSILDVLMFCSKSEIKDRLNQFRLV